MLSMVAPPGPTPRAASTPLTSNGTSAMRICLPSGSSSANSALADIGAEHDDAGERGLVLRRDAGAERRRPRAGPRSSCATSRRPRCSRPCPGTSRPCRARTASAPPALTEENLRGDGRASSNFRIGSTFVRVGMPRVLAPPDWTITMSMVPSMRLKRRHRFPLGGLAHRGERRERGDADGDAEHHEEAAQAVARQGAEREANGLQQGHGISPSGGCAGPRRSRQPGRSGGRTRSGRRGSGAPASHRRRRSRRG